MTAPSGPCHVDVTTTGERGWTTPAARDAEYAGTDAEFARRVLLGVGLGAEIEFDAEQQAPQQELAPSHAQEQAQDRFRFRFRFRSRRDAHVELVTIVSSGLRGTFDADGRMVLAWSTGDGMRVAIGEHVTEVAAATPVLLPANGHFHLTVPDGTLRLVSIDADFVHSVRGLVRDRTHPDAALSLSPDPAAVPALRSSTRAVAAAAAGPARVRRLSVQVRLVQTVLRAYGPRAVEDPSSPAATTVRLAEAYLTAHCHEDVSLPALSRAIGVSVRTIQSAFVQVRGTTPTVFLREMRLDRVRLALQTADPAETTVAEIAVAWGFRHLGRFSAVYLRSFGEYPAETLRSRHRDDLV